MKNTIRLGLLAAALTIAGCGPKPVEVASVNGKTITEADMSQQLMESQAAQGVLRDMILTSIISQAAAKEGIKLTDEDVNRYIQFQKDRMPPGRFEEMAYTNSSEANVKRTARRDLELQALSMKGATVSEDAVAKFYKENAEVFTKPQWKQVGLLITKDAKDAAKADALLKQGVDYVKVSRQFSADPGVKTSPVANYNWFALRAKGLFSEQGQPVTLPPDIVAVIKKTPAGKTSAPVKVGTASVIVRVNAEAPAAKIPAEEVKGLISYAVANRNNQTKPSDEVMQGLIKDAKVDVKMDRFADLKKPEVLLPPSQPGMPGGPSGG